MTKPHATLNNLNNEDQDAAWISLAAATANVVLFLRRNAGIPSSNECVTAGAEAPAATLSTPSAEILQHLSIAVVQCAHKAELNPKSYTAGFGQRLQIIPQTPLPIEQSRKA